MKFMLLFTFLAIILIFFEYCSFKPLTKLLAFDFEERDNCEHEYTRPHNLDTPRNNNQYHRDDDESCKN